MGRRGLFAVVVVCAAAVGLGVLGWSLWQGRAGGEPVAAAADAAADSAGPATVGVEAQDFAFVLIRTGEVSVLADGSSGVPLALTPQEVFLLRRQPQVVGRWQVTTPLGGIGGDCRSLAAAPAAAASAGPSPAGSADPSAVASADPAAAPSPTPSPVPAAGAGAGSAGAPVVCAVAPADAGVLVPGLPAQVRLEGPVMPGALVVPVSAVWWRGSQAFVTTRSAAGDSPVAVDPGPSDGAVVVLRSGPAVGEQVLLAPLAAGPGAQPGAGAG